jgi:predicted transcriptional regulator
MVYRHTMKRTTIKLPKNVDTRLRYEAERRGTTISEITREAILVYLGLDSSRRLGGAKAGRSGRTDVSERIEEILRREARR